VVAFHTIEVAFQVVVAALPIAEVGFLAALSTIKAAILPN
jgi:hypothetical protein